MIVEYYQGSSGDWYWRLRDTKSRKIVATGAEGYVSKSNVKRAFKRVAQRLKIGAVVQVREL